VYDYGPEAVLKLYPSGDEAAVGRYPALEARLRAACLPFATPTILRSGRAAGVSYTVMPRMPGRLLTELLPQLDGPRRRAALSSYLCAAERLGTIEAPERPFGHLLRGDPLSGEAWPDFLRAWAAAARAEAAADLRADVPDLDRLVARYEAEADLVGDVREKRLVHGDYWPGNVFIGERHEVCAVIDFSRLTLVGDRRLDVACAVIYLQMVDGCTPTDVQFLQESVAERYGPPMARIMAFYRLHYAFVFSGCKRSDPATYRWCLQSLRDPAACKS
jgi:aminoglycoside phosphotransferase (APT) family kinase protein